MRRHLIAGALVAAGIFAPPAAARVAGFIVPEASPVGDTAAHVELASAPAPARRPEPTVDWQAVLRARELQALTDYLVSVGAPPAWAWVVQEAAEAEGLSAWLVAAVIHIETGWTWNPTARGAAGEFGLMQLMPATAEEVAGRELADAEALDPATNIRLGVKYLAKQVRAYRDPVEALAAYNGGPGGRNLRDARRYAEVVMNTKMKLEQEWTQRWR